MSNRELLQAELLDWQSSIGSQLVDDVIHVVALHGFGEDRFGSYRLLSHPPHQGTTCCRPADARLDCWITALYVG